MCLTSNVTYSDTQFLTQPLTLCSLVATVSKASALNGSFTPSSVLWKNSADWIITPDLPLRYFTGFFSATPPTQHIRYANPSWHRRASTARCGLARLMCKSVDRQIFLLLLHCYVSITLRRLKHRLSSQIRLYGPLTPSLIAGTIVQKCGLARSARYYVVIAASPSHYAVSNINGLHRFGSLYKHYFKENYIKLHSCCIQIYKH